jgi:hypothetical protein
MLAPPPYENDLFGSADALRDACVGFAKSEGYVINQRDLDKNRGRLRLKCAHKTTSKQGGSGVGLRQSTTNNTDCPFRVTAWENVNGGWRITMIVADHNHDGTECLRFRTHG